MGFGARGFRGGGMAASCDALSEDTRGEGPGTALLPGPEVY